MGLQKPEPLNPSKRRWNLIFCLFILSVLQSPAVSGNQPEDTLLFREGETLLSKGETERALWRFKKLVDDFPQSPLFNEARFRMGFCYTRLKRPSDAIRILNALLSTFLPPPRMVHVFTLLGDNHLELKDPLAALRWYGKGLLVPGQSHDDLRTKVKSIIDGLDMEEVNHVESLYRGAYAGSYAKSRLDRIAKQSRNDRLSKKIHREPEKGEKPRSRLGVILPLSGVYQPFGERALQAIQLGLRDAERGKNPFSLIIRDSKGNSAEAEKAVEELATKEKVVAILGPLLTVTVDGALTKAQQWKIPVITFSQKERTYAKNEFVFQNSLTPSDQIRTLSEFAITRLNLRTFAVLYPNSPYGLHFKNLFVQEVARRERKVLGVAAFQEGQTDFGEEIKAIFKIESRGKKRNEFIAGLSVDGLFIPDAHNRVGSILSQVAYYDITGSTFLGTNAWNGPDLIPIAGNAAEGSVFVDAFFTKSSSPLVARFVEEFQKVFNRPPDTLEALCYDGANLIGELILAKQISSPYLLREELRRVRNYTGITGLKGFGEDGRAIRALSILRVNKGRIEQVSQ